jgi:transglutaminase-like putative cysteine protease
MASKTLAAIAIILLALVFAFFVDTHLLLEPVLTIFSPHDPELIYNTVLRVDGYMDQVNSHESSYVVAYSVSNFGNITAENVTFTVVVDGEQQTNLLIPSLSVSDTANYSLVVPTASGELHIISLQASCMDSADTYSFSIGADVPRTFSDKPELVKLFVTPREPSLVALKNEVLEDAPLKLNDWIELRNWVGNNIQYRYDDEIYGIREYWQFGKETLDLRTGDCEDFAILLCSLYRAAGYSPDDVYVVIGKNANGYHAWVKIKLESVGWYNVEPQENGWATFLGDFLTLSGYQALCEFNDQQFITIG